jgi:DNA-directed RNA polymerase specialized sigma24 family protein
MSDDSSSLHTRPSLLLRVRDPKDRESWKLFVELYTQPVMRYCRLRGLQNADVADVAQDVMAQVARAMHTFDYNPERGRFRDWLAPSRVVGSIAS